VETFAVGNAGCEEVQSSEAASGRQAALDAATDAQLLGVVRSLPKGSERRSQSCAVLVGRYQGLVRSCVNRYRNSPESAEDLMQVGYLGLMKAINNFDPSFGRDLGAYAQPCITGELKRHFRDKRWQVHVERPVQERMLELRQAEGELTHQGGSKPNDEELAGRLECSEAEVREARQARTLMTLTSLDAPLSDREGVMSLADTLGEEDQAVEHALSMQAIATHWGELPRREQRILLMRFYGDMSQAEIGKALGISQMHVSRLLAHALGYLRDRIAGPTRRTTRRVSRTA
jgi:RNA polymerase sigma-B factor